jgi:hypothetical protein
LVNMLQDNCITIAVAMKKYISKSGKQSGVTGYEIGTDHIIIQFNNEPVYKYSYISCGKQTTDTLKELALASKGLGTYISQHHPAYEWKRE